ncbi:MAG: sulfate/thiosulfate transport system substrate-binding protein [Solirubrobacteraceae bacterium]|nr:sulfate/thiosulfate transport system substrate-binding protein [Solirubrobacteraceae bacterium]
MNPRILITACFATVGLVAAGCGGSSDSSSSTPDTSKGSTKLSLVAYSTPEVVYDEIIPEFQKTAAGKGVGFQTSYGASGEQSRAVEAGLKADIVTMSLAPDIDRLVKAGLVDASWNQTPTKGFVTTSEVAFVVRKGNPKGIHGWDDLLKPGVKVVTPNPFTSGAAKWNLLGAVAHGGLPFVSKLIKDHVSVQPKSGRDALQAFTGGEGDVLISYEYEYTTAVKKGEKDLELVRPDDTLKIENPIAVTKTAPAAAKAFVKFVLSPAGQQHFADWGYRPVDQSVFAKNKAKFPDPAKLTTIDQLGGWDKVNTQYFDPAKGSIAKIEQDAGVSPAT